MSGIDCETVSLPWSASPENRLQQWNREHFEVRARCGFAPHRGARGGMAGVGSTVELRCVRRRLPCRLTVTSDPSRVLADVTHDTATGVC
jgi:hypothetical protein